MVEVKNLVKRYGDKLAVDDVSFTVDSGEILGFLGPNGAGKSTTMKLLLGIIKPGGGELSVDGKSYPRERMEILRHVGSFIEQPAFYPNLTGAENLDILRRILGLGRESGAEALDTVGLTQFASRQARKYSLGMKQRLGLAVHKAGNAASGEGKALAGGKLPVGEGHQRGVGPHRVRQLLASGALHHRAAHAEGKEQHQRKERHHQQGDEQSDAGLDGAKLHGVPPSFGARSTQPEPRTVCRRRWLSGTSASIFLRRRLM